MPNEASERYLYDAAFWQGLTTNKHMYRLTTDRSVLLRTGQLKYWPADIIEKFRTGLSGGGGYHMEFV